MQALCSSATAVVGAAALSFTEVSAAVELDQAIDFTDWQVTCLDIFLSELQLRSVKVSRSQLPNSMQARRRLSTLLLFTCNHFCYIYPDCLRALRPVAAVAAQFGCSYGVSHCSRGGPAARPVAS